MLFDLLLLLMGDDVFGNDYLDIIACEAILVEFINL